MESEFFGHKKGSFTGAHSDKTGLFQAAHGGSLFNIEPKSSGQKEGEIDTGLGEGVGAAGPDFTAKSGRSPRERVRPARKTTPSRTPSMAEPTAPPTGCGTGPGRSP